MEKMQIPLTLERVGSEGKFFTDNLILKLIGCTVLAGLVSLLVSGQLASFMPSTISIAIGVVLFVLQETLYVRKLVLKEKQLLSLLDKMVTYQILDTNNFYDIYDYIGKVALHNSGHISLFLEVIRGSTIGSSESELVAYYKALEMFENSILQLGYTCKVFDFESKSFKEDKDIMYNQINNAKQVSANLAHNLAIKYKYTEVFMDESLRKDRLIYVIVSEENDTEQFEARINQMSKVLHMKLIQSYYFLDESQVDDFVIEFYDTKLFNKNLTTTEDMIDVLQII